MNRAQQLCRATHALHSQKQTLVAVSSCPVLQTLPREKILVLRPQIQTRTQTASVHRLHYSFAARINSRQPSSTLISYSSFHTNSALKMSDADYEAFLNKANQDTSGGEATTQSKGYGTRSVNTAVPKALEGVQEYYTSDADEPFEPVALNFDGDAVSAQQLKTLLGHNSEVEELSVKDWDPKGQYKSVLEAVKKAGSGEVKVFKVELGGTRTEYYVVSVTDGKVVGLKALSVES